ncbi:hypothetical protein EVAR_18183_1 [Eumeta japonica]|uniref:Uncharacterized protein n=1 Tax=Eumeta variegata TaxID=151549 RepID=A0A4C1UX89_EUMVA|nr:hypothetical protein EVAR_18183_1 [Eumeta japonica]
MLNLMPKRYNFACLPLTNHPSSLLLSLEALLLVLHFVRILGFNILSNVQFRKHLEGKVKLASKKLEVLNFFELDHRLLFYKTQVQPHLEYCCHIWVGAPQYQLLSRDRIQRRPSRIVDKPVVSGQFDPSVLRRDVASLYTLYRVYDEACSEELFNLGPTLISVIVRIA